MKARKLNLSKQTELDMFAGSSKKDSRTLVEVQPKAPTKHEKAPSAGSTSPSSQDKCRPIDRVSSTINEFQQASSTEQRSNDTSRRTFHTCSGCNKLIKRERYLLKVNDDYWHENCLRCDKCHRRLGELGPSLYTKGGMNLCQRDYLDEFGETGVCSMCNKTIGASELVMKAKHYVYHLDCFACDSCNERFCVGDSFYLNFNRVICHECQMYKSSFAELQHPDELYSQPQSLPTETLPGDYEPSLKLNNLDELEQNK